MVFALVEGQGQGGSVNNGKRGAKRLENKSQKRVVEVWLLARHVRMQVSWSILVEKLVELKGVAEVMDCESKLKLWVVSAGRLKLVRHCFDSIQIGKGLV